MRKGLVALTRHIALSFIVKRVKGEQKYTKYEVPVDTS
jgi:hypothetical protein